MSVPVKKIHERVNVLPIDLRREYLQGILCHRLIKLNSLDLVHNRITRAADGPLITMYTSHTRRNQMSPPVDAFSNWNAIKPEMRCIDTSSIFKARLKASIKKTF